MPTAGCEVQGEQPLITPAATVPDPVYEADASDLAAEVACGNVTGRANDHRGAGF